MEPRTIRRTIEWSKWEQDVEWLGILAYTDNRQGHRLELTLRDGGEAMALAGYAARATFLLGDTAPVKLIAEAQIEDGVVRVTFPAQAYAAGQATVLVTAEAVDESIPLYAGRYVVRSAQTETTIDPQDIVPDLTQLLAQIDAMKAATASASEKAEEADAAAVNASGVAEAMRGMTDTTNMSIMAGEATPKLTFVNRFIDLQSGQVAAETPLRCATPEPSYVPPGAAFEVVYDKSAFGVSVYRYASDMTYIKDPAIYDQARYVRLYVYKADNTQAITPEEAEAAVQLIITNANSVSAVTATAIEAFSAATMHDHAFLKNANLLAGAKRQDGVYINNGVMQTGAAYNAFWRIPVKAGHTYTIEPRARLVFLTETIEYGKAYLQREENVTRFTPSADGYVNISMYAEDDPNYAFYEAGEGEVMPADCARLRPDVLRQGDPLCGKTWAPLGDSFTAGTAIPTFDSGELAGKKQTYPYLIAERTGIGVLGGFFAGGRTLACPADGTFTDSVTCPEAACYYQNIPEDVDYVTLYLGINDSHREQAAEGGIPLGTMDDETTATHCGAWNVVLTWLRENRPFAHVGILVSNGCDRDAYREAQIAMAIKHGVPYIDLNGDARTPVLSRSTNAAIPQSVRDAVTARFSVDADGSQTGTVDGHPNAAAHAYASTFIEQFLRSI